MQQANTGARRAILAGSGGFTVLEVLVAVLVFSIGLVGAAALQTSAVDATNRAHRQDERVYGAEQWMEDLRDRLITTSQGYAIAAIFSDNCTGSDECADGSWYPDEPQRYGASMIQYRVLDATPLPNLVTVQVRAVPANAGAEEQERRAVVLRYIRSRRYNE